MKRIIMPVGTSIFTNALDRGVAIKCNYDYFNGDNKPAKPANEFDKESTKIEALRTTMLKDFSDDSKKTAAETFSIDKIVAELKENVQVYLLATDTVLSRLACELLKAWFEKCRAKPQQTTHVVEQCFIHVIDYLQVTNRNDFEKKGLVNIVNCFYKICGGYYEDVILNVTGGFKATVPYLTFLAQLNSVPLKYIFEDSGELITIPQFPVKLLDEFHLFDTYQKEFSVLEGENSSLEVGGYPKFSKDAVFYLENVEGLIALNFFGRLMLRKYRERYFTYYASKKIRQRIEERPEIKRLLHDSFAKNALRMRHTIQEDTHLTVFKKEHDVKRIYYFTDNEKIYVYQVFSDGEHDDHESYIRNERFTDQFRGGYMGESEPEKISLKSR